MQNNFKRDIVGCSWVRSVKFG